MSSTNRNDYSTKNLNKRTDYLLDETICTNYFTFEDFKKLIIHAEKMDCSDIHIYSNGQIGFNTPKGYYVNEDF